MSTFPTSSDKPHPRASDGTPRPNLGGPGLDLTGDEVIIDLRDDPAQAEASAGVPQEHSVSGRPLDLAEDLQLRLLQPGDRHWELPERFVHDIYVGDGFCEPSPLHRVEALQDWTKMSTWYVVFDDEQEVVATSRLIRGHFNDLPVGHFARTDFVDADPLVELSSLVATPSARGFSVIAHICRAIFVDAWRDRASALCFATDDWMVELLANFYCLPVRPIATREAYMGGVITPGAMTLAGPEFVGTARRNPAYWQWMTEAFTPEEIVRWELPIVLTDPVAPVTRGSQTAPAN